MHKSYKLKHLFKRKKDAAQNGIALGWILLVENFGVGQHLSWKVNCVRIYTIIPFLKVKKNGFGP